MCLFVCLCVCVCMWGGGRGGVLRERECGVDMITDVLYSLSMYIRFCVKRFELSYVVDIAL